MYDTTCNNQNQIDILYNPCSSMIKFIYAYVQFLKQYVRDNAGYSDNFNAGSSDNFQIRFLSCDKTNRYFFVSVFNSYKTLISLLTTYFAAPILGIFDIIHGKLILFSIDINFLIYDP